MNAARLLKILFPVTIIIFIFYSMTKAVADPDLWGYMAFGKLFWGKMKFPYQDAFSFLPTRPLWVYHEWLTGVIFYPLYQKGGAAGLQLLRYAFCLTSLGFVYLTARRRGANLYSTFLFFLFILPLFMIGFKPVRAQIFTYTFFAASLYLLESARLSGSFRKLWLLVPLQIFWCNLHGGFLSGLGLIALYGLGEALSRRPLAAYAAVFLVACLATLVNPYGLAYWHYMFEAITMPRPEINEWLSLLGAFHKGLISSGELILILCPILIAILLAVWARWREVTPILILGVTLVQGLMQLRHIAFFLILAAAYQSSLLRRFLEIWQSRLKLPDRLEAAGRIAGVLVLVVLLTVGVLRLAGSAPLTLSVPSQPQGQEAPGSYYPVGGIGYILGQGLRGKLLTEFSWGEYLIWELYPLCLVALDGRYETVYTQEVANRYFDFIFSRQGWQKFLEDYPPDLILIDSRRPLATLLQQEPGWRQVYTAPGCSLFVRQ